MYVETGEYIVYGKTGICQVMGVTTMDMERNTERPSVLYPAAGRGDRGNNFYSSG